MQRETCKQNAKLTPGGANSAYVWLLLIITLINKLTKPRRSVFPRVNFFTNSLKKQGTSLPFSKGIFVQTKIQKTMAIFEILNLQISEIVYIHYTKINN